MQTHEGTLPLFEGQGVDPEEEQRALVALSMTPGVGPGRIRVLLSRLGGAAAALRASRRRLEQIAGIGPATAEAISRFNGWAAVDEQFARADACGAWLLAAWDERYPALLREIYDPPALLWVRGDIAPDEPALAMVGTRRATDYGRRVTAEIAGGLVEAGYAVVSGLAYGIDAAAHQAALDAGGRTIAVLGSGVDRVYPSRHIGMARRIAEGQGAVISEYPLGAAPDAANFPRRNRIISGLASGVVVTEAFPGGGALITARVANEQNREVFAVPHAWNARAGEGCNQLIQKGYAKLVMRVADMLEEVDPAQHARPPAAPPADLNEIEQRLYDALTSSPVHIDTLCAAAGVDASSALVYLLSLEFKGLVTQMAGMQFLRA